MALRIGILTDGLEERVSEGRVEIRNGGVGVYIERLIRALQALPNGPELVLVRFGNGALDVYRGPRTRSVGLRFGGFDRYARWLDLPYVGIVRELGLDLLHYPNQFGGYALPRDMRRVVTLHDLTPFVVPRLHPWRTVVGYRLLLRPSLARADHVIVDSEATRAEVLARGLVSAERVSAIPLGVEADFHPGARDDTIARRLDLPARYVLAVGVLEPRKNHGAVVEAVARVRRMGEDIGVVIVGRDGWGWNDPREDPRYRDLVPHLRVLANLPSRDLPAVYAGASALLYPSIHEGFGLPIVEAMASGVPVLTSTSSSLPEVAGGAAVLVDPHDVAAIADRLHEVLRDADLRKRLVDAGLARARTLSWARTAERTLEVYERVVGRR